MPFFRRMLVGTLIAAIAAVATHDPAEAGVDAMLAHRHSAAAPRKPWPIRLRLKSATERTTAELYRIVDFGTPRGFSLSSPSAFNNTGQVIGLAGDANQYGNCELYDGKKYRTLATEPVITFCNPSAVNDRNARTGTVDVVGVVTTAYQTDSSMFYSVVDLGSKAIENIFYTSNPASVFAGLNASGTAVAMAYYAPLRGFFSNEPPFLRKPATNSLTLLQPSCTVASAQCGTLQNVDGCGFGGCLITSDGSVLLEGPTGNYELIAASGKVEPIPLAAGSGFTFLPIINNAKQILYSKTATSGTITTNLLDVKSGRVKTLPPLPKKNCFGGFNPFSLNDNGAVLGYALCESSSPSPYFYFTYDAKHGMQELAPKLPSGTGSIEPIAINDLGQILIGIVSSAGVTHWGILQPPA